MPAIREKFFLEWVSSSTGKYRVRTYPEGDSATFKRGALVIYDDSEDGVNEVAVTAGVPGAQTFIGVALQDASGTSDTDIDVLIPTDDDVFSAPLASDQDTLVAPAADGVYGELFGLIKLSATGGTGTEWVVDTGNTNWVKVVDYDPRDVARRAGIANLAAGDRVLFRFLGAVIDSAGHRA